jgi:rhamnosyltransferase
VPGATAIVRAKDEAETIERTLSLLRRQTVEPEIIVVDSGSRDGTVEIARRFCDKLIEIEPEEFSYGRALNIAARVASAPFHFNVDADRFPERPDWIALSLRHYENPQVAATNALTQLPDGRPMTEPFYQDDSHARANPDWGYSLHAASWRASVWEEFPFDEELDYAEDREWAIRVTAAGWLIAFDPELLVDMSSHWREGARAYFRRHRRGRAAIVSFADPPPYRLRELARDYWHDLPTDDGHSPLFHRTLNYVRVAGYLGKYVGDREGRRRSG